MYINKLIVTVLLVVVAQSVTASVRLKEIATIDGARQNAIVGYGIVVGLAGTGDSSRSRATTQSILNTLTRMGVTVSEDDINSRNTAAVMITANLPAFSEPGRTIDVNVSSIGDARDLVGGTLLLAPLKAANGDIYAIAQGSVSVGGYSFDRNGNTVQKNHLTVGIVPNGGTIEKEVKSTLLSADGKVSITLQDPDYTTASRLQEAINKELGGQYAKALHAGKIEVVVPTDKKTSLVSLITKLENVSVIPDHVPTVVINERTGTVVAGSGVHLDDVTISQGSLKVIISTQYNVSQPGFVELYGAGASGVQTKVVPDTTIEVDEKTAKAVQLPSGATIGELVANLQEMGTTTRDIITIIQAIKRAGALRAQLIIE